MAIDITPDSGVLHAMRNQNLDWATAIGELVDNSFDADASSVEIEFGPRKVLTVSDNGRGCGSIERMWKLGDHYGSSTTALGQYGVGLKDASCWLWGETMISTCHKGVESKVVINLPQLAKSHSWSIPDAVTTEATRSGTRIRFRNIERNFPSLEKLASKMAYIFSPAIRSGRQIVIRGRNKTLPCAAWSMPDLVEIVQDEFEVNGKPVRIDVGIVTDDAVNPKSGFNYCYGHRVIMNSSLGSNGYSTSRICGIVTLGKKWRLGKNKTEIVDSDQDLLADAIWRRCESLIKSSCERASALTNTHLAREVTQNLRKRLGTTKNEGMESDVPTRKEKRDTSSRDNENHGVKPKKTGRKRKRSKKSQDGVGSIVESVKSHANQVSLEWKTFESDKCVGEFDIPGNVVYLNSHHKLLVDYQKQGNTREIENHAILVITHEVFTKNHRGQFPAMLNHEDILEAYGHLIDDEESLEPVEETATHSKN